MVRSGLVLTLAVIATAHAQTNEAALTRGWDDSSVPLSSGRVTWSATPAGDRLTVSIVYEISGSIANHSFTAGVHFFDPDGKTPNPGQFGGRSMGGRQQLSRDGVPATIAGAWDFGVLTTDSRGNGKARFSYSVPRQRYAAQFTIRKGANCPAQVADCACVFRTGGSFSRRLEQFGGDGAATTTQRTSVSSTKAVAPIASLTGPWVHSADQRTQTPDNKVILIQDRDRVTMTQTYKTDKTNGRWVTLTCQGSISGDDLRMQCVWAPGGNPFGYADFALSLRISSDRNHLDSAPESTTGIQESHYSRVQ